GDQRLALRGEILPVGRTAGIADASGGHGADSGCSNFTIDPPSSRMSTDHLYENTGALPRLAAHASPTRSSTRPLIDRLTDTAHCRHSISV
ncbi:MAG: hypothetical protein V2I43_25970, partial [Parvularcula sp.]|nr:hypothetical protein [Parvularcula sp.]